MKRILLLLFTFGFCTFYTQTNCNPTTAPNVIYYSNSTSSPTTNLGFEYLCGPNTTVYDTVSNGCHFVYVNSNCSLILRAFSSCAAASEVWVKNTATLTLLPGGAPVQVNYEGGAVINNPSAVPVSSVSCSSILFPIVNCTPNTLYENIHEDNLFEVYPNPADNILRVEKNKEWQVSKIEIVNCFGQVIKKENARETNNFDIQIDDLINGIYTLNLINYCIRSSKKFVVLKQ